MQLNTTIFLLLPHKILLLMMLMNNLQWECKFIRYSIEIIHVYGVTDEYYRFNFPHPASYDDRLYELKYKQKYRYKTNYSWSDIYQRWYFPRAVFPSSGIVFFYRIFYLMSVDISRPCCILKPVNNS